MEDFREDILFAVADDVPEAEGAFAPNARDNDLGNNDLSDDEKDSSENENGQQKAKERRDFLEVIKFKLLPTR